MENSTEQEVSRAMRFLAGMKSAETTLTEMQVNYWLDNHSSTLFCNGELRQVIFTPITSTRYKVHTKAINGTN